MTTLGKKLINNPENVVDEALEGLTMIHPGLRLLEGHRVVVREEVNQEDTMKKYYLTLFCFRFPVTRWRSSPGAGLVTSHSALATSGRVC